jgi:hypothetical protein
LEAVQQTAAVILGGIAPEPAALAQPLNPQRAAYYISRKAAAA